MFKKIVVSLLVGCLLYAGQNVFASDVDLDAIVINASRSGTILGQTTRPVSIITSEEINNSPAKSLPELLASKVGVYGAQYGNIKSAVVDLRGSGESSSMNILVLVNGRRTNQIDLSGQDWAQIDPKMIDRIEIIRGSGTVLYGDNANSGVINIITKKGLKNVKPSVTLSTEYGNYQSSKQGLDLNGGTQKLDYQFNYGHEETSGFRANNNYWANDFNTQVGIDPTDSFGIDFSQGYHSDRYQLSGALFPSSIALYGRQGIRPSLNKDHGWTSDAHYDVTPRLLFTSGTSEGEISLYTSGRKRSNKLFTGSTIYEVMSSIESYEIQPKVVISTPVSEDFQNKFTTGYDYFYAKNTRRSGFLGPNEDLVFIHKVTHGIYALDEITLDEKWLLNVGARGSWVDYTFNQTKVIASKVVRKPSTQGYEAGLGYKYNPESKVYMDFARSYRLPAVDEFYQNVYDFGSGPAGGINTDLTYQIGNQFEFGIKDQSFKDIKLGLNFFIAQYKNEIYLFNTSSTTINKNYDGRTRHYGLEAEASTELLDGKLEPFANWTLQEANFRGGLFGGNEIPAVSNQLANAGLTYRPYERLSTTLSSNYVGERFAISDQTNTQPKLDSYITFDWSANYGIKDTEFWVSLRNLLNKKYFAYGVYSPFGDSIGPGGDIGYYPAPGRNVTAGVKVKF